MEFGDENNLGNSSALIAVPKQPQGLFSKAFEICRDLENNVVYFKDGSRSRLQEKELNEITYSNYVYGRFRAFKDKPNMNIHNYDELHNFANQQFSHKEELHRFIHKAIKAGDDRTYDDDKALDIAVMSLWEAKNDHSNGYESGSTKRIVKSNETYRKNQSVEFLEDYSENIFESAQIALKIHKNRKEYIKTLKDHQKSYFGKKLNLAERSDNEILAILKKVK